MTVVHVGCYLSLIHENTSPCDVACDCRALVATLPCRALVALVVPWSRLSLVHLQVSALARLQGNTASGWLGVMHAHSGACEAHMCIFASLDASLGEACCCYGGTSSVCENMGLEASACRFV